MASENEKVLTKRLNNRNKILTKRLTSYEISLDNRKLNGY